MRRTFEGTKELRELRGRIEHWRATRESQGRMPEALWEAAAVAATNHGVSRVASELKLGYAGLKRRMQGRAEGRSAPRLAGAAPGFLEVSAAQLLAPSPMAGTLIEYSRRDGSKLTVKLPTGSPLDVLALLAALGGP
jgi:hypothetical protein